MVEGKIVIWEEVADGKYSPGRRKRRQRVEKRAEKSQEQLEVREQRAGIQ